jgi:hypothetical protein
VPCLLCRSAVMEAYFPGVALVRAFANLPLKSHAQLHHLPRASRATESFSPANSSDTGLPNTSGHASVVRKDGCLAFNDDQTFPLCH